MLSRGNLYFKALCGSEIETDLLCECSCHSQECLMKDVCPYSFLTTLGCKNGSFWSLSTTTVKVSIISFFCLSTKMRWITNFGLERRASHASHSSLFQDSWITPVTISDPKLVYSSYFSSLPSFLDESFLVQQNHGCHWTSYKPASFREKTWWICTLLHLLVFILPKDSSSK